MRIKNLYLPVTSAKIKLPPKKSVSIEIHSSTPTPSSVKNGSTVVYLFSKSSIKQLMRVKTRLPRSIAAPIMTNFTMRMRIHALIGLSVKIKLKSWKLVLTHVLIRQLQRRSVPWRTNSTTVMLKLATSGFNVNRTSWSINKQIHAKRKILPRMSVPFETATSISNRKPVNLGSSATKTKNSSKSRIYALI